MKKCVRMYVLVMIAITEFVSCSHIGTVSVAETTTTDSVTMSTDASPASKKLEELALLAVTGNYIATEDEMEASLKSFLETHVNTNSARNVTSASTYTFAQSKKENINTTFNSIGGFSARSATTASDTVPIYYYTIDTGETELIGMLDDNATESDVESFETQAISVTDLAIMTTDRRIGTVLAYVEHCSLEDVENLSDDEGSPLAIFLANLAGYIQVTAELWNNALTSDYITAAERSITARSATASEVVLSGDYTYDDDSWVYNSGNEDYLIPSHIAKYITQSTFKDIMYDKLGYSLNGCGATAVMQLLCFYQYPQTITTSFTDSDGTNYYGSNIWTDFSSSTIAWSSGTSNWNYVGSYYYNLGRKNVYTTELDYINNNSDITVSELEERYGNLYSDVATTYSESYSVWSNDKTLLSSYENCRMLEGERAAYSYLKNVSVSTVSTFTAVITSQLSSATSSCTTYKNLITTSLPVFNRLCALTYQTVVGCKSTVSSNGTGTTSANRQAYLKTLGYTMDSETSYSYAKVKSSIENGHPLMMRGITGVYTDSDGTSHSSSGHCWIIDAYANLTCTAYLTSDKSTTVTFSADYVHCNWGWGKYENGYYLSGVFDAQYYPLYTTTGDNSTTRSAASNAKYYYQYNLYVVPNIAPGN